MTKKNAFLLYRCDQCPAKYSVSKTDGDIQILTQTLRCPVAKCKGTLKAGAWTTKGSAPRHMTAKDLYTAASGMGLPEETKCSPKDIRKLMIGKTIEELTIGPASNRMRSTLMAITLEGGIAVHLAPSPNGVTIYKVTRPHG